MIGIGIGIQIFYKSFRKFNIPSWNHSGWWDTEALWRRCEQTLGIILPGSCHPAASFSATFSIAIRRWVTKCFIYWIIQHTGNLASRLLTLQSATWCSQTSLWERDEGERGAVWILVNQAMSWVTEIPVMTSFTLAALSNQADIYTEMKWQPRPNVLSGLIRSAAFNANLLWIFGSDRSPRSHNLCLSVCPAQSAKKVSKSSSL